MMKKGEVAHSAVVWTWPNKVLPYAFSKQFSKSLVKKRTYIRI